jgi:hypothetical protein
MRSRQNRAVASHRRRLKRRGIVRVELRVRTEDVPLVRGVADALADPERAGETRALLRERVVVSGAGGLKDWLAAAPLEGIALSRDRDAGRDVDL